MKNNPSKKISVLRATLYDGAKFYGHGKTKFKVMHHSKKEKQLA